MTRRKQAFQDRLVHWRDVFGPNTITGLSDSTGENLVASGQFPQPFAATKGMRSWWLSTIVHHLNRKALEAGAEPSLARQRIEDAAPSLGGQRIEQE